MKHVLLLLITVASLSAYAQPNFQFSRSYGGTGIDSLTSLAPTKDGGYILAGVSTSSDQGYHAKKNVMIIKTTANGTVQWKRYYGGSEDDIARSVIQTRDGNYVFSGSTFSINGDVKDHGRFLFKSPALIDTLDYIPFEESWTVKLDLLGNIIWSTCYSKTIECDPPFYKCNPNYSNKVIETSDGGILIAGAFPANGYVCGNLPFDSMLMVKMGANGVTKWARGYVGAGNDLKFYSVVEVPGGYAAVGTGSWAYSYYYTVFIRTNLNGVTTQSGSIEGDGFSYGADLKATSDGGLIIAGSAFVSNGDWQSVTTQGKYDYFLAKISSAGLVEWKRKYGGTGNDYATSIEIDKDGGYFVGGYAESDNLQVTDHTVSATPQKDYWLMKASSGGTFIWGKSFGGTRNDFGNAITKTADAGLLIGGASASMDAGFVNQGVNDFWIIKLDSCGSTAPPRVQVSQSFCKSTAPKVSNLSALGTNIKWYTTAVGGNALPASTLLTSGTYYASQTTAGGCQSARVASTVVVNNFCRAAVTTAAPELTVYPNPGTGLFTLDIAEKSFSPAATIVINDAWGRPVIAKQPIHSKGVFPLQFDLRNQLAGIYYLTYNDGVVLQTIRLAIIR